ncbi:Epithelial cell-transforming sequence 2 oncogene-like [Oryzias melastigma]|uniref:Epithelial cell-transforming sequence 2 oncogene-like n=1 Tax=Oryzias melastigma TaxID=30732 RepID=A0A834C6K9_ORYME|nr:Epithelial cell-transforming sequence 2 oncogene-like [Oryzias melastigma]
MSLTNSRWESNSRSDTRFSTWTPLCDKQGNLQLFEERVSLVTRWFDLWTRAQREHLLRSLLARCSKSQLSSCRDLLMEMVPASRLDFTAVLPRFLSLYIMSFLSPLDLCRAAQVSWYWRTLTEQDCLWVDRCVRRGWFLPYTPAEKEFGAWKSHYISCVSTLDLLISRETQEIRNTLIQQNASVTEEEEDRRRERRTRLQTRHRIQEEKRWTMSTRRLWGSNVKLEGARSGGSPTVLPRSESPLSSRPSSSRPPGASESSLSLVRALTVKAGLSSERIPAPSVYRPPSSISTYHHSSSPALLLLISNRIPAYELVLSGVRAGVTVVLYDHRGALSALLSQVEGAVSGRQVQRLGLLVPGGTEEVHVLERSCLTEKSLLDPDHREFWEKISGWVVPAQEGGGIDIFCPLAASGYFLSEVLCLHDLCVSKELSVALTRGLTAVTRQNETRPVEFLSSFLKRCSEENEGATSGGEEKNHRESPSPELQLQQSAFDWRAAAASELLHSETLYLGRLSAVLKVYQEPLTAALNSHKAILSRADIQIIFTAVSQLLQINRVFHADLQSRLQQWRADQCVGDVFVKLGFKLKVYTNYLNNYTTILHTIDKCREAKPAFRAFLKTTDRTLATHMLSLQELLLCPVWRIQEYVTLLQVLSSHTIPDHPDSQHLHRALSTMLHFRRFIQQLKQNSQTDGLMEETQRLIQGCPNLREDNRHLIGSQDAALLRGSDDQIPESLRTFEHVSDVGLFLFSDALVLTRKSVQHTPFTPSQRSTHTFTASVALSSLTVREILHTRYVRHAFILEGPCRFWVCAIERGEEKEHFLSVLRSAVNSALTGHRG